MPEIVTAANSPAKPKFLDQVRSILRTRHYSLRTEEAYLGWIRRFILFQGQRHPREMGAPEVAAFLNYLAQERSVAAATQNQALNALLFLYEVVLERKLGVIEGLRRRKKNWGRSWNLGGIHFGVVFYGLTSLASPAHWPSF